jgi:hypothetical protein
MREKITDISFKAGAKKQDIPSECQHCQKKEEGEKTWQMLLGIMT